jgi:hypothetical protein
VKIRLDDEPDVYVSPASLWEVTIKQSTAVDGAAADRMAIDFTVASDRAQPGEIVVRRVRKRMAADERL